MAVQIQQQQNTHKFKICKVKSTKKQNKTGNRIIITLDGYMMVTDNIPLSTYFSCLEWKMEKEEVTAALVMSVKFRTE